MEGNDRGGRCCLGYCGPVSQGVWTRLDFSEKPLRYHRYTLESCEIDSGGRERINELVTNGPLVSEIVRDQVDDT